MPTTRRVLTVFIASPGDVDDERRALASVASRINRIASRDWGWEIDLRGWEDTLPGYSRPQELINPDVDACDVFVGVLWKRWGQDSGTYSSGFEEEYRRVSERRSRGAAPEIMLYFRSIEPSVANDPGPQLKRVLEFRREIAESKQVLYKTYESLAEWETLIFEHLMRLLGTRAVRASDITEGQSDRSSAAVDERRALLQNTHSPPQASTLLDLVGDPRPTGIRIADRWRQSLDDDHYVPLPCAIGPDGPWALNLLSRESGSTTLIVGASGAGKSEAFYSIVASNVLTLSPHLLRTTFINMKWSSFIAESSALGFDERDGDLPIEDQLKTIEDEIYRRERLIVSLGCRDLHEVWAKHPELKPRLPLWLICVDEYSGLLLSQEAMLDRFLEFAGHARASGISVLLGTQRIAGVGGSVRGISGRRICFRVIDYADSLDVVGTPDAAMLPMDAPGTAVLREDSAEPRLVRFCRVGDEQMAVLDTALKEAASIHFAATGPLSRA